MRLKQLIESRGVAVEQDMALKSIRKRCSSALKAFRNDKIVWRGVGNQEVGQSDFISIKPSASNRISANTHNLYTLVIDSSSKWKEYPDRSKSIICSTDYSTSDVYGRPFAVFPSNGYTFGVCSGSDMWISFEKSLGNGILLNEFNDEVQELVNDMDMDIDLGEMLKTKSDLVELMKLMDKTFDESGVSEARFDWLMGYNGSFMKLFENILDPSKNGFTLSKDINNIPKDREVWTDSDSYLVSNDWIAKNERLLFV